MSAKNWILPLVISVSTSVLVSLAILSFGKSRSEPITDITDKNEHRFIQQLNDSRRQSLTTMPDFTTIAEETLGGVVSIDIYSKQTRDPRLEYFFGNRSEENESSFVKQASGSGVIITEDGYVVTNNHVIEGADQIRVILDDNRSFDAKVIGRDSDTDIALLKIEAENLIAVKMGDSDNLKVGEWVLAIGNPYGFQSTVTAGIISAKSRSFDRRTYKNKMGIDSFIQTDAAINSGNSGGALINMSGELIGINTMLYSKTGTFSGYGFAVPVSIVSKVVADLKLYGTVQRAYLGIGVLDINGDLVKKQNLVVEKGVYVEKVYPNLPAAIAGLQTSDVVIGINDMNIKNIAELNEQINRYSPGDRITITFMRGSQKKTEILSLKNAYGKEDITRGVDIRSMGVKFQDVSTKLKQELSLGNFGIQVASLTKGRFQEAGVKSGFIIMKINNVKISTEKDVEFAIDASLSGNNQEKALFIVGIYPNGRVTYYAINLN